ncbi:hypothetical protein BKA70DRAFT_1345160 [Coprinopsis sp. MPI-PUGE-AT-0042]|nr:hypothetical protein BKA70DRAFT_1345160 [Coprinopsis sp. MPI-PUGE-AT-0042]
MANPSAAGFASFNARGEVEWYVDRIMAEQGEAGEKEYQVQWRGYDDKQDTWEDEATLKTCEALGIWKEQINVLASIRDHREWEVDRIMQQHIDDAGRLSYCIRWRECEHDEDTWEEPATL